MTRGLTHFLLVPFLLTCAGLVQAEEWDDLMGESEEITFSPQKESKPDSNSNARPNYRKQAVRRIDQEIMVLRAEMSQRNGDYKQVTRYLRQLDKQHILPPFTQRIAALRKYVSNYVPDMSGEYSQQFVQKIRFPIDDPKAVVAILLPTSGDYEYAGLAIQKSIQRGLKKAGFRGKLIALDSNLYSSAFELWDILKYHQPDFVFGPLTKEKVAQWQKLRTRVQTLFFNEAGFLSLGNFSLTPNKIAGLEQVFQLMKQADLQNVLVLRDQSEKSIEIEEAFQQAWLNLNPGKSYVLEVIESNVGQSLDAVMGVTNASKRHRWFERILNTELNFSKRSRKDIEAIISFVPQNLAIQISPYLSFLANGNNFTHVWYPSKTPSAKYLDFNRHSWAQTFVVLPQSIQTSSSSRHRQIDVNSKNGLFHALGQVAVEIVVNPGSSESVDGIEYTEFGDYVRNPSGQFHLLPVVYWSDNGMFEKYYQK